MSTVINPTLYRRILDRFGDVRILNRGERRIVENQHGIIHDKTTLLIKKWGEQYLTACPFCRAREKLAISYMYGTADANGRPTNYLVSCFAHGCLRQRANREALARTLGVGDGILEHARLHFDKADELPVKIELPKHLTPIQDLPSGHPVREFMAIQGLRTYRVGKHYNVTYCKKSNDPLAHGRLIIPYFSAGQLRTWQSLSIQSSGADDGPESKYLSAEGIPTGRLIYNLDRAQKYDTVVIVAEPLNVWRFGSMAICSPSATFTERQQRKLVSLCRKRKIVVLMTAAQLEQIPSLLRYLDNRWNGRFVTVQIPRRLPSTQSVRTYLRDLIVRRAEEHGIEIALEKCPVRS